MPNALAHWAAVYGRKPGDTVSWFQSRAQPSLDLILHHRDLADRGVIDVGAGASRLVDGLLEAGLRDVALLDIADTAFEQVRQRLGPACDQPKYLKANVTEWLPDRQFGIWHDRAAFHFLTDWADQDRYIKTLRKSLVPRGIAILATFAPNGPEMCSGLPVQRYSSAGIADRLDPSFDLIDTLDISHRTPGGSDQRFQYSVLRKTA